MNNSSNKNALKILNISETIFWDFDGVIKESVEIKSLAYQEIFNIFNDEIQLKIGKHHEKNGGMSRYEKIPLYLSWTHQTVTKDLIDEYCLKFSKKVKNSVIYSPWVNGVKQFLEKYYKFKNFILITATPQEEIEEILEEIKIKDFFKEVHGAPINKTCSIKKILKKKGFNKKSSVMIGDSFSDYNAAKINNLVFILRKTNLNLDLQKVHNGLTLDNFKEYE